MTRLRDRYIDECRNRVTFLEKLRYNIFCNGNPILLNDGFRMYLNPNDMGLSRQLWCRGFREPVCTEKYKKIVKDDMNILDIGSNIGYYPLMALNNMNNGMVYCFEPHPINFSYLKRNLELNDKQGYCKIYNMAVVPKPIDHISLTGGKHLNRCSVNYKDKGIRVKATDLKHLSKNVVFDIVRMDVEGYEFELLGGLKDILMKTSFVYLEIHPFLIEQRYGDLWYKIIDYLDILGLDPFYLVKEHGAYHEFGVGCNKNNFYTLCDILNINKNYKCGLGVFFRNKG